MFLSMTLTFQGPRGKPGLPGLAGADGLPVSSFHFSYTSQKHHKNNH